MQEPPVDRGGPQTGDRDPAGRDPSDRDAAPAEEWDPQAGDRDAAEAEDWDLERWDLGDRRPARRSRAVQHRPPTPLTPLELRQRAQARRRLSLVAILGVGLGVATLIAAIVAGRSAPSPRPTSVPAGYKAVDDGVFAYAVPRAWTTNQAATDSAGDRMTGGADGWVAEHVETRKTPLRAGETPPAPFRSFGESRPTPYSTGPAGPTRVTGTTSAFRYEITRPGGFRATAVEAWSQPGQVVLWMFVHADPTTTATILSTLALG